MSKTKKEAKRKEISVEELIQDTEQKILDNEYTINDSINYHGEKLSFSAKIITQREFNQISGKIKNEGSKANGEILHKFLINKKDNKNFSHDKIDNLPAGLVAALSLKIMDLSGFNLDDVKKQRLEGF